MGEDRVRNYVQSKMIGTPEVDRECNLKNSPILDLQVTGHGAVDLEEACVRKENPERAQEPAESDDEDENQKTEAGS